MSLGRNKADAFGFLVDRVEQKLQGWKNKSVSKAGKVTLLKSAAQSIPNFWMNLLLLPALVCDRIQKKMNGFWWGNGGNSRGIRWMSWENMCGIKEEGGLGFRELNKFNIAMLAKQGWRLLNGDNQLVTGIMKARYYPNSDFLSASLGSNPSYMWRSIMKAQDVIKQGCRRRIGNGASTRVWQVPWLPCNENGFLTTIMPQELESITVRGLMTDEGNHWDDEVLRDICNERDVEMIRRIPLPMNGTDDSWYWMLDDKGIFTVKSCYRKLKGEARTADSSFWKKLWSIQLPGKIINFLWRLCHSCLPTATALAGKRVQIDIRCPWCLVNEEDAIHVLFLCSFAKSVWNDVGLSQFVLVHSNDTVFDVLKRVFGSCNREQIVLIGLFCWSIWNRRNKWVWDRVNGSVFGVKSAAMNMLSDWKAAQQVGSKCKSNVQSVCKYWSRPPQGWVKVNVDAALFPEQNCSGMGAVIRDEYGNFLRARSRRMDMVLHPREAEALSLKEALSWAKEQGFKKCMFETDAKILADACNGGQGRSFFHTTVADCVSYFKHFENVLVTFVSRSANTVAHLLARATYSTSGIQEWNSNTPEFLIDAIVLDSI